MREALLRLLGRRRPVDRREAGRRVIEEMAREQRGRKPTIRGQGYGGDTKTAHDAAFGSDTSGGP